ncbi:hypothetical protein PHMEG_00020123 [Phytophthora megakarya]|uniref:Uncharacterized protein n=1 Tax=Phytophthora megakarya TaxID=4795 RepID=A0A225VQ57_9STRA|nr:hypothetical protein PHMEG_00020123 [Phytophthora megakarya]
MQSQALRRVVHAEEQHQADRRRQQHAQAASASSCASNAATPTPEVAVEASQSTAEGDKPAESTLPVISSEDNKVSEPRTEDTHAEDPEDDDDYLQKHLLSRPTSAWTCLEDTQQANCLALNAPHTLMAVGERDGRVTIWDNTTIRVITRELDPTLIALPVEATNEKTSQDAANAKKDDGEKKTKADADAELIALPVEATNEKTSQDAANVKKDDGEKKTKADADAEGSGENDDASVEDDEDERTEDAGSVEEDVATEEEAETEDNNESEETKTEDEADTAGGVALTLADLRVVKTALKVVSQCAWSCDSRWLFAGFDGTITALSAHPRDPKLVIVSFWNSRPVLLDVISGERTELENVPLENTEVAQPTPQNNSRHPVLASCARYGRSGKRIYCATSKSTLAVLDAATLQCLDSLKLTVIIQFVDLCVNLREDAMLLTSSKGIHEFVMESALESEMSKDNVVEIPATVTEEHPLGLREVALHSTGAVRAPWAVCCFSGGEEFVVGTPVVRHRHVGENGLFTWHRASTLGKTTAQHNVGVKDGVLALAWDRSRQSVLSVSTSGALHVLEEQFTTTWPGAMYPADFRLITDNELHLEVFDRDIDERKRDKEKLTEAAKDAPVDVFTVQSPSKEFPDESDFSGASLPKSEFDKPCYIPAIPIAHYHRRHLHQLQGSAYNEDKHFGLGQSVFEPLKGALGKQKKSSSRKSRNNRKKRRR